MSFFTTERATASRVRGALLAVSLVILGCDTSLGGSDAVVDGSDAPVDLSVGDSSTGDLAREPKPCGPLTCVVGEACVESVNGAAPPIGGWPTQHYCVHVPS